jgi:hypothetical protein
MPSTKGFGITDIYFGRFFSANYGHTHYAEQVPLDMVPLPKNRVLEKVYFNSGTWRKVFEHTAFDPDSFEFIGWHVLTFIVFYLEKEKEKNRNYEVWSASLGFGR